MAKKKTTVLPKAPEVPDDLLGVKLREFFNWKNHELITRHEVEKLFEQYETELSAKIFSKLNETELSVNKVKDSIDSSIKEFDENFKRHVEEVSHKVKTTLETSQLDLDAKFNTAIEDLEKKFNQITILWETKINDSNKLNADKLGSSIKNLKDALSESEKRMQEFSSEFASKKFDEVSAKLTSINARFFELKESNDFEILSKEFKKKTKDIESAFNNFENVTEGLNQEISQEIKDIRETFIPQFKIDIKEITETFKAEVFEKLQNMDPVAVAQSTEERINLRIQELTKQLEESSNTISEIGTYVKKEEFNELYDKFKGEMKKVIEWINYFDGKA